MASKLMDIHNMLSRDSIPDSPASPPRDIVSSADSATGSSDHYEYPRGYFEALINNAKSRYEEASKFYFMKKTYSAKFGFYITLLQDLFIELASPPPTLPMDTYSKLARLRHDIRRLQLNFESRRDLLSSLATVDLTSDRSDSTTEEVEPREDDSYELEAANAKQARLQQLEMARLLQTITDLSLQEMQIRERRLEAEAEYRRQFNENPPTPAAALAFKPATNEEPKLVSSTVEYPDLDSLPDDLHPSIYKINCRPPNRCVFCPSFHWSHLCLEVPTLKARQKFYQRNNICFNCGNAHRGLCHPFDRYCKWPQCGAKNDHHSAVCPNVSYPITQDITDNYIGTLLELKRRYLGYTGPSSDNSFRPKSSREDCSITPPRRASKRSNRRRR